MESAHQSIPPKAARPQRAPLPAGPLPDLAGPATACESLVLPRRRRFQCPTLDPQDEPSVLHPRNHLPHQALEESLLIG